MTRAPVPVILVLSALLSNAGCSVLFPIRDGEYQSADAGSGSLSGVGGNAGASPGASGGSPNPGSGGTGGSGGNLGPAAPGTPLHKYAFDVFTNAPADTGSSPRTGTIITNGSVNAASDTTRGDFYFLLDNSAIEFPPDVVPTGPVTMSLWVKPEKPENRSIVDQQSSTSDAGFRFMLGSTGGTNVPELRVGGANAFDTVHALTPVPVGTWAHLAFSITGSPGQVTVALYVNGKLDREQTSTLIHPFANPATPLRIGMPAHNNDIPAFMGGIDDFRIYDRVLTNEQILGIYLGAE